MLAWHHLCCKVLCTKRSSSFNASHRGRGGFDDDGDRAPREEQGPSKADTSSSWGTDRKFEPAAERGSSRGGFSDSYTSRDKDRSGGFADKYGEDRTSFADRGPSKADEEDRWSRKAVQPSSDRDSGRGFDRESSRSFGASNSDSADRWSRSSAAPPSENGTAGPGERKRLTLAARTGPPKELPPPAAPKPKEEANGEEVKPASDAPAAPPKPRSNPFGTARPREEVLKEQGRDWKREERALEHSRVKRCVLHVPNLRHVPLPCFNRPAHPQTMLKEQQHVLLSGGSRLYTRSKPLLHDHALL